MISVEHANVLVEGPYADGHYVVTINGKLVPFMTVSEGLDGLGFAASDEEKRNYVLVTIDERMGWWIAREQLAQVLHFTANAMAVAAGFACWGGPKLDPFGNPPTYGPLPNGALLQVVRDPMR